MLDWNFSQRQDAFVGAANGLFVSKELSLLGILW